MEMEEVIEEKNPKGRDAILESYRKANPDNPEPDDSALYDFAHNRYSDLDKKYNELNGANGQLAEFVAKDPKFGAVLSMMSGENAKSFPYSMGSVYGNEPFTKDGDARDEFEKGYQENLSRLAESEKMLEQAMKNIETYHTTLNEYGKEKSLSTEQIDEINSGIMQLAENVLTGSIPKELIDLVYKGLNYEKDVDDAADTGFVEGKNTVVEAKIKEKTAQNSVPHFGNGGGAAKSVAPKVKKEKNFYEEFKESEV